MSLPVNYITYGEIEDSATNKLESEVVVVYDLDTDSFVTDVTDSLGRYSVNIKDIANEGDTIVVATASTFDSYVLDLADAPKRVDLTLTNYFTITTDTYIFRLPYPDYGTGDRGEIGNNVRIFDFFDESFDTVTDELETENFTLIGKSGGNAAVVEAMGQNASNLDDAMNNHEEAVITDIGACTNDTFVVMNFRLNSMNRLPFTLSYEIQIERKP